MYDDVNISVISAIYVSRDVAIMSRDYTSQDAYIVFIEMHSTFTSKRALYIRTIILRYIYYASRDAFIAYVFWDEYNIASQ